MYDPWYDFLKSANGTRLNKHGLFAEIARTSASASGFVNFGFEDTVGGIFSNIETEVKKAPKSDNKNVLQSDPSSKVVMNWKRIQR